ncbi:hypothetical protein Nepgr_007520 [Nepenthes gracilis]|uniref:UspA domain-containing protein n=1 Tax=Nepenthes gracilis TaxID=150966 RepID=A0AAD3S717_NEPGR|nr:hypothetical protein Nepgr_007520 [Nepenthes gracilis]
MSIGASRLRKLVNWCAMPMRSKKRRKARKIAIAVDLSDRSAYAVKWAADHYLRPTDAVVLLHVQPTSVFYGADWGCVDSPGTDGETPRKMKDDFHALTVSEAGGLARPLVDAKVPYKIHSVKDRDRKERLCLEVERLGLDALIIENGSVSDYCIRHCVCPVVVVRHPRVQMAVALPWSPLQR